MEQLQARLAHNLKPIKFLYKYVHVIMISGEVSKGWLKSIDPETGNFILINLIRQESSFEVAEVILVVRKSAKMIHLIRSVESTYEIRSFLNTLFPKEEEATVDEDRRDRLFTYLKSTRVPVKISEDGRDICLFGCAIQPPYHDQNVMGSNPRVVEQIGRIINEFYLKNADVSDENKGEDEKENPKNCEILPETGAIKKKKSAAKASVRGNVKAALASAIDDETRPAVDESSTSVSEMFKSKLNLDGPSTSRHASFDSGDGSSFEKISMPSSNGSSVHGEASGFVPSDFDD